MPKVFFKIILCVLLASGLAASKNPDGLQGNLNLKISPGSIEDVNELLENTGLLTSKLHQQTQRNQELEKENQELKRKAKIYKKQMAGLKRRLSKYQKSHEMHKKIITDRESALKKRSKDNDALRVRLVESQKSQIELEAELADKRAIIKEFQQQQQEGPGASENLAALLYSECLEKKALQEELQLWKQIPPGLEDPNGILQARLKTSVKVTKYYRDRFFNLLLKSANLSPEELREVVSKSALEAYCLLHVLTQSAPPRGC
ncbi:MAG: hypothetical protein ACPGXY_02320 [Alphaproteobacteria bacterium]